MWKSLLYSSLGVRKILFISLGGGTQKSSMSCSVIYLPRQLLPPHCFLIARILLGQHRLYVTFLKIIDLLPFGIAS